MYLTKFAARNINFLSQLFEEGNFKPWDHLKLEYNLINENLFWVVTTKTCHPIKVEDKY